MNYGAWRHFYAKGELMRLRAILGGLAAVAMVVPVGAPVALAMDDDFTDATLTVTPSVDLVDLQTVNVVAENFNPVESTLYIAQCAAGVEGSVSITDCDTARFSSAFVDENGRAEAVLQLRREIVTASGVTDCAEVDACVIGAATLESDLVTVIEGAIVPVSFDPTVPAVPRLTVDVEVISASAVAFTVRVTCSREAEAYLDGNLTQTAGNQSASSYGYSNGQSSCGPDPVERTIPLAPGTGRFRPGAAELSVFASAYDGVESASGTDQFDVQLRGNANKVEPFQIDGEFLSVEVVGHAGAGANQFIEVDVTCAIPFDGVSVYLDVSQYAGRDLVQASGYVDLQGCDGVTRASVPLSGGYQGVVVGGPARVGVMANAYSFTTSNEYIGDFAAAVDLVRLKGRVPVLRPDIEPLVGTYVSIESQSLDSVTGTIECDEPTMVDVSAQLQQFRGRSWLNGYGYSFVECDGVTEFTVELSGDLRPGPAVVYVYAYGYNITESPDYPYPIYEYVWDDMVVELANLRR